MLRWHELKDYNRAISLRLILILICKEKKVLYIIESSMLDLGCWSANLIEKPFISQRFFNIVIIE